MSNPDLLAALKAALDLDPRQGPLWVHYAQLLEEADRHEDALAALRTAVEIPESRNDALHALLPLLRQQGLLAEALIRAESALDREEDPLIRAELERVIALRDPEAAPPPETEEPDREQETSDDGEPQASTPDQGDVAAAAEGEDAMPLDEWASQFDWGDLRITFDDVIGLDEVKRQINLRIIAPFKKPELFEAYGRQGGGGLLLYGPPGCGKTFIARATAGELGARFLAVSIHDIVDKYYGESEKLIHALFEDARRSSPTVLFFDEFDALGARRSRDASSFWKSMVDQLLQEMDGVGARNRDVLVIAATNMPWSVDSAFRRPGRFDRVLFVPPPEEEARLRFLERKAKTLPQGSKLRLRGIAKATSLFTGADLESLCERAAEAPLERALESGEVHPVTLRDFENALTKAHSTATEWLSQAANHARYANDGGTYDELVTFLKRIRKW